MSEKYSINCLYAEEHYCTHPKVKKRLFFFKPYCVRSDKVQGFQRCALQLPYKEDAARMVEAVKCK